MWKVAGIILLLLATLKVLALASMAIYGTDKTGFFITKQVFYALTFGITGWGLTQYDK